MNIQELLLNQAEHMKWADAITWKTLLNYAPAEENAKLKELLLHLHFTQGAFLMVWNKKPFTFQRESEYNTLAKIIDYGKECHKELTEYLLKLDGLNLDEIVLIPWAKRFGKREGLEPEPVSLCNSIEQVIMHSSYHRAQINQMLRQIGGEPHISDYIYWLWVNKPNAS